MKTITLTPVGGDLDVATGPEEDRVEEGGAESGAGMVEGVAGSPVTGGASTT